MKTLIEKLLAKLGELKQQANDALAKLKPMEQQEAAQEMAWVFRAGRNCLENLNEIAAMAEGKLAEFAEQIREAVRTELKGDEAFRQEVGKDKVVVEAIKAQLLQSGELLTRTDHEGKIQAAETAKEAATRTAVETEFAQKGTIAQRRTEAETEIATTLKPRLGEEAAGVAKEVASKITDKQFAADGYKTDVAATVARIKSCVEVGVVKGAILQEVAGMEEGTFKHMHDGWKDQATQSGAGRVRAPLATPAGGKSGTEKKKVPLMV